MGRSSKQKNKKEGKGISIAAVVILIGVIVIIVLFARGKSDKSKNGSSKDGLAKDSMTSTTSQGDNTTEEFVSTQGDGVKENKSDALKKDKKYNDLTFSNIQLKGSNGGTTFLSDVTNNGSSKHDEEVIKIILLDKEGKEIETLYGIVADIEPGEKTQLSAQITADIVNAYDVKIEAGK